MTLIEQIALCGAAVGLVFGLGIGILVGLLIKSKYKE